MEVKQIYELMNTVTSEVLGTETIVNEDLTNVVDVGEAIFNANKIDNYVKSLVDRIGKIIFVTRKYNGDVPSILMDSWLYGSVIEKIQADLPEASENDTWNLENGKSYPQDVFYQPKVSAKFYNSKVTFEIPMSFTERQVRESFTSATQLNSFLTMLYNSVDTAITVKIDSLIMRTINNMTALTINSGNENVCVNLLANYNKEYEKSLKVANAITDPDFIRYASYIIGLYSDRIGKLSTLFNLGHKARFTPTPDKHVVMLSDFKRASDIYLQSDVYHNDLTKFVDSEVVSYWQGSGTGYNFEDISNIHVTVFSNGEDNGVEVNQSGILAVMFDTNACGVCNPDRRVTTAINNRAEFYTNYYKFDASYFNDTDENFVVFYIDDVDDGGSSNSNITVSKSTKSTTK